jgi:predicted lipoprotein with Yx(FWY)xxD motif
MGYQRKVITIIGGAVAVSALSALGGGIGAGAATVSGSSMKTSSPPVAITQSIGTQSAPKQTTLRAATAAVNGKTEAILVNAKGLPLYYYQPDTAKRSLVTGGLAQLWPPLVSGSPTAIGAQGKVTVVRTPTASKLPTTAIFCTPSLTTPRDTSPVRAYRISLSPRRI